MKVFEKVDGSVRVEDERPFKSLEELVLHYTKNNIPGVEGATLKFSVYNEQMYIN